MRVAPFPPTSAGDTVLLSIPLRLKEGVGGDKKTNKVLGVSPKALPS